MRCLKLRFCLPTILLLFSFLLFLPNRLHSAVLIHQFDFDGNLNDSVGGGLLTVHPNTATSGFGINEWWWTATTTPGGGLILNTSIADSQSYSLGFRVKYNQVGPSWKKIISFKGSPDDNGLYLYNSNLQFYPFGSNTEITYSANTFYDFIFVRSSDDIIRVYVVKGDGTVTKVYEQNDPGDASVPIQVAGKYQFMLFMDDTQTTSEWTTGGTIKSIRVWNGPLSEGEISGAIPDVTTGSATDITSTTATLNGTIYPKNLQTVVTFEYGLTNAYGSQVTADQSPVNGSTNQYVSASIMGLLHGTTYHYRVTAINSNGTSYGSDHTFITSLTVTASAGANGGLDPTTPSPATVNYGSTTSFKFNADTNYHIASVSGCGGTAYSNSSNLSRPTLIQLALLLPTAQ